MEMHARSGSDPLGIPLLEMETLPLRFALFKIFFLSSKCPRLKKSRTLTSKNPFLRHFLPEISWGSRYARQAMEYGDEVGKDPGGLEL